MRAFAALLAAACVFGTSGLVFAQTPGGGSPNPSNTGGTTSAAPATPQAPTRGAPTTSSNTTAPSASPGTAAPTPSTAAPTPSTAATSTPSTATPSVAVPGSNTAAPAPSTVGKAIPNTPDAGTHTASPAPTTVGTPVPNTPETGSHTATHAAATVQTLSSFEVGQWSAGAYSVAGETAFDHCAGAAKYSSGITLAFSVSNDFRWSMGFFNPKWGLTAGSTYPITFSIDGSDDYSGTATAISPKEVQVPLAPTVGLFKRFMQGDQLKVDAASEVISFDLTDTSKLLPDLLKCVENYSGTAPQSSNPFAN